MGEKDEIQLFFYFTASETSPKDDPLVLWLTGGPGCSSFSALTYEIGKIYKFLLDFYSTCDILLIPKRFLTKYPILTFPYHYIYLFPFDPYMLVKPFCFILIYSNLMLMGHVTTN